MMGFGAFLAKEARQIVRTWPIWVIPGMLVFFGITSPIVALVAPRLIGSLVASQPGVVVQLPDPTAVDAFGQFVKNLSQIVIIAVIVAGAGTVSSERSAGTAILVLAKPLSREAFVLAKLVSNLGLLVAATLAGTTLCAVVTRLLFPPTPLAPFLAAVGLWLANASLLVSVMTLFSVLLPSRGAAAGAGLGFLFVMLLLSIWPAAARFTFVGLPGAVGSALARQPTAFAWPLATALASLVLTAALAMAAFARQEL